MVACTCYCGPANPLTQICQRAAAASGRGCIFARAVLPGCSVVMSGCFRGPDVFCCACSRGQDQCRAGTDLLQCSSRWACPVTCWSQNADCASGIAAKPLEGQGCAGCLLTLHHWPVCRPLPSRRMCLPARRTLLSPRCRQPLSSAAGPLCPRRRRVPRWPAWFTTMGTRLAPLQAAPLAGQPTCRVTCRRRSSLTAHSRKLLACRAAQCRAVLRPSGKAARTAWGNRRRPAPPLRAGARRLCTARRQAAHLRCSSPRVCPSTLLLLARSCSRGRRRACRPCRPLSSLHWLPGRPQCS